MFGLFKRKMSLEPVRVDALIDIERSIFDVFALLDFQSPRNALKALGFAFHASAEGVGRFVATDPALPGTIFTFDVVSRTPPQSLVFDTALQSEIPLGALVSSRSAYQLAATGEASCRVTLHETATLRDGLGEHERRSEEDVIELSVHRELERLKAHAEDGVDAALQY